VWRVVATIDDVASATQQACEGKRNQNSRDAMQKSAKKFEVIR
jgi:hypothetical protein